MPRFGYARSSLRHLLARLPAVSPARRSAAVRLRERRRADRSALEGTGAAAESVRRGFSDDRFDRRALPRKGARPALRVDARARERARCGDARCHGGRARTHDPAADDVAGARHHGAAATATLVDPDRYGGRDRGRRDRRRRGHAAWRQGRSANPDGTAASATDASATAAGCTACNRTTRAGHTAADRGARAAEARAGAHRRTSSTVVGISRDTCSATDASAETAAADDIDAASRRRSL